jgi:hypothetical protein
MHMRGKRFFPLLVGCAMAVALSACAQSPLRVRSAERSRAYSIGTRTVYPWWKPGDVFLKVTYSGLSADDREKALYITDGKNRYPVHLWDKANSFVVVTVPESQLEFQVVLGDYPPVSFKADETVQDKL